jgi:hypothetical protein
MWIKLFHPLYMAYCKLLEIVVSRKYLVLWVGLWALTQGFISGVEFLPIALGVLGIQGFLDNKTPPRVFFKDDSPAPGAAVD